MSAGSRGSDAAQQLQDAWPELVEKGMPADDDGIRTLAASGLVQFLWRNGPVEDAHASRRGPSDGQMMSMSIDLCRRARRAIDSPRVDLLGFEAHLLDIDRPWPGTSQSVRSLLHGHIGAIRQHVKSSTNRLLVIEEHFSTDLLLKFLCLNGETRHVGMSGWPTIVDAVTDIAAGRVSADDRHIRRERLPRGVGMRPHELRETLLDQPADIAADDPQALIDSGVLMAAESILIECRWDAGPSAG